MPFSIAIITGARAAGSSDPLIAESSMADPLSNEGNTHSVYLIR